MAETAAIDSQPVANPRFRNQTGTVGASALAQHLDCSRTYIGRLEADAAHAAKTEMLQLRLMEKRREPVRQDEVNELIDGLCGAVLTALSGMPGRCAPRGDLATRRSIERGVFEVRSEMAKVCQEMADRDGELPLDEQ